MRLMLIGEKYSSNLGDGIIFDVVKKNLSSSGLDIEFVDFDISLKNGYERKRITFDTKAVIKKEIKYILTSILHKTIEYKNESNEIEKMRLKYPHFKDEFDLCVKEKKVDAIVLAGGQLLNITFVSRLRDIIEVGSDRRIPIILNACGWGNNISDKLLQNLDILLENRTIKYISIRDGSRLTKSLNSHKYHLTDDTAVLVKECMEIPCEKKDEIGLGIMISKNQDVFVQICFWKNLIKELKEENIKFSIFTNGDPYDEAFARYLCKVCNLNDISICIPQIPNELVSIIASYKKIISMRLHSLICAYSYHIPFVAIAWDEKIRDFCEQNQVKEVCFDFSSKPSEIISKCRKIDESKLLVNTELSKKNAKANIQNIISILKKQESKKYE